MLDLKESNTGNRVAFRTLGCKQNQFDTELLRLNLLQNGFEEASVDQGADWLLLNTCAVTERAMAKARGEINRWRRLSPRLKIVACGCGVRYRPENYNKADYLMDWPFLIAEDAAGGSYSRSVGIDLASPHGLIPAGRTRALLRIQSGCDQGCSYCIVPKLRGPSTSVPLKECSLALSNLVDQGAEEIVLTGTNIVLWGRDLPGRPTLQDLLTKLTDNIGSARLRLSSLEPQFVTRKFIEWCANQPQICQHFHFAVQSGSDRVLDLMNRGRLDSDLWRCLQDLRRRRPEFSVGADVMTGFPGETEGDFRDTLELIESIPFTYLHVFPFSERPGTTATRLSDSVPVPERLKRAKNLRKLDSYLRRGFAEVNAGTRQDMVMIRRNSDDRREGLTSNYLKVFFPANRTGRKPRFMTTIGTSEAKIRLSRSCGIN